MVGPLIKATLSLYADTKLSACFLDVFLMSANNESSFSVPSMWNAPLKILCRQCSELTCENPNTSESVSGRPS